MNLEIGEKYLITDKKSKIMSRRFHYLLGQVVEVTGEVDEANDRVPVKTFCEVPEGSLVAKYVLLDMIDKEFGY